MSADFNDPQRLDFRLLRDSSVILYFRSQVLEDDVAQLIALGYQVDRFECSTWSSEDDMHDSLAAELAFPRYYGRNLSALEDCLGDLAFPAQGGRALLFCRYDAFVRRVPDIAWHLLDIIAVQSRSYLVQYQRLVGLIQSDDPSIEFRPLGLTPALWNPRERLDKDRDL